MFRKIILTAKHVLAALAAVVTFAMPVGAYAQSSDADCNVQTAAVMQQSSENAVQNYLAKVRSAFQAVGLSAPSGLACLDRWANLNFGQLLSGNWGAMIQSMLTSIINAQLNALSRMVCNLSNTAMQQVNNSLSDLTKGVTLPGGIGKISPHIALNSDGTVNTSIGYTALGTSGNVNVTTSNNATVPAVPSTDQQVSSLTNWFGKLQNSAACIFGRCQ